MSLAAIAAGADGLIIEVHENPEAAWSDGAQSLKPERFASGRLKKGRAIARVVGRETCGRGPASRNNSSRKGGGGMLQPN